MDYVSHEEVAVSLNIGLRLYRYIYFLAYILPSFPTVKWLLIIKTMYPYSWQSLQKPWGACFALNLIVQIITLMHMVNNCTC